MVNLTTTCHPIRHFNILIAKLLILLHKYCIVDQWSVFTCCIASLTAGHYCLPILLQSAGNNTVNRTDGLVHLFVTNLLEDPWKFNRKAGRFSQQVSPCNYNFGVPWIYVCGIRNAFFCATCKVGSYVSLTEATEAHFVKSIDHICGHIQTGLGVRPFQMGSLPCQVSFSCMWPIHVWMSCQYIGKVFDCGLKCHVMI